MSNDNIIPFKKKEIAIKGYPVIAVFLKGNNVGIEIKDGSILLTPFGAIQFAILLVAAIKAAFELINNKGE